MPRKTSFYLSDEDDALLRETMATGVSLREIMRRGLGVEDPHLALARQAATEALEALRPEIEEWVGAAVQRAFGRMRGEFS
jgi:hypothetical protein